MTDDIEWTETGPGFWESSAIRETGHTAEYYVARVRRIGGRKPISGPQQRYEFAVDYFDNEVDPPYENLVIGETSIALELSGRRVDGRGTARRARLRRGLQLGGDRRP